jgi:cobyrinic acid a,c-diamide synthase
VYAVFGGLMYLARAIRTRDGAEHSMGGLVPGVAAVGPRLAALGYAEVETRAPTLLGPAGLRFRGHEFRYSELEGVPEGAPRAYSVRQRRGGEPFAEGYGEGSVLASYVHAHWASCPTAAEGFVRACAAARRSG